MAEQTCVDMFDAMALSAFDSISIKKQIILDDRLSDAARTMLLKMSLLCGAYPRLLSKDELTGSYKMGISDKKYKRVMHELESLGYAVRERRRSTENGRFGGVLITFRLPELPLDLRERPMSKDDYLAMRGVCKTPAQSHSPETGRWDVEKRRNQSFPSSVPQSQNGTMVLENQSFPSSVPQSQNGTTVVGSPHINKQTPGLLNNPPDTEGVPCGRLSGEEKVKVNNPEVCLFQAGRSGTARKADGVSHVLKNCTESQVRDVFDMVSERCPEKRFREDQYLMCRKKIDELLDGDDDYKKAFFDALRVFCVGDGSSANVSRTPSYWINDDFGDRVRERALSSVSSTNSFS